MPDTDGSFMRRAALAACLTLIVAAGAAAQTSQPVVSPAPSEPDFFTRYDFHLSAAGLITSTPTPAPVTPDQRFSSDAHFGGSLDFIDYVAGRTSLTIDYQAVLGDEYRPFDPNQGNYVLEVASSGRVAEDLEIVGVFHHVSRHLSDRPKRGAIAWNVAGARVLKRLTVVGMTVDGTLDLGKIVQHSYVDYTWIGELNILVRRPVSERLGVFAHGTGQFFAVDGTASRGTQGGGLVEAGIRLNGKAGALELFAGYEKRVDADPLDRESHHWGLAGFRLLSR